MKQFIQQGEEALRENARQIKITGTVSDVFRNAIQATMVGENNASNQEAILAAAAMESAQQEASLFAVLAAKVDDGHKLLDPWEDLNANPNNTLLVTLDGSNDVKDNDIFNVREQLKEAEDQNYSKDSGLVVVMKQDSVITPLVAAVESFAIGKGFKVYHVKKK